MEKQKTDIHISGHGTIAAGEYGEIHISGIAKAQGNIACDALKVSGSATFSGGITCANAIRISGSCGFEGPVRAADIGVSGSTRATGNMQTDCLHVSGSLNMAGDVEAKEARISGSLHLDGALSGGTVRLSGGLRVRDGVECETLDMSGGFTAQGLLNAENVRIRLGGRCRAEEIGGENIDVRLGDRGMFTQLSRWVGAPDTRQLLEADTIEGTTIYLENTCARVVRGENVQIGSNCKIDAVEYTGSLTADPSAEIGSRTKTGANA